MAALNSVCTEQKWQGKGEHFQNKRERGNEGRRKRKKKNSEYHVFWYDKTFP